ncbi:MAG: sugar-transfer associated ATP-grasp domain-containing protein [Pseudomonadota bacterium]
MAIFGIAPVSLLADALALRRRLGNTVPSALALCLASLRYGYTPYEVADYNVLSQSADLRDEWLCDGDLRSFRRRFNGPEAVALAHNKHHFAVFCGKNGLSAVPTLGFWGQGRQIEQAQSPWPDQVLLKPAAGALGRGIEVWQRQEDNTFRCTVSDGFIAKTKLALSEEDLRVRAAQLSWQPGGLLAQPCLQPHPIFATVGVTTGMPTTQTITGRWPDGQVRLIAAHLLIPGTHAFSSNVVLGPKRIIELDTGTTLPSKSRLLPKSQAEISLDEFVLPDWQSAVGQVLRGHAAFPGRVVALGWDTAFTPNGPLLLEANLNLSLEKAQSLSQMPAGLGPMGDLLDAWLDADPM